MNAWKPGDVAVNVNHGYRGIFVPECTHASHMDGPHWHNESGYADPASDTRRPLVVIDPEDREQVARLADAITAAMFADEYVARCDVAEGLRAFANPTPPRCTASLNVFGGAGSIRHECRESVGHDGPHVSAGASWAEVIR